MFECRGYAASSSQAPLAPFSFARREPGPSDVRIEIKYCGVCHSDLNRARDIWGGSLYTCVPGHEIVGRVEAVGGRAGKFKPGDIVGVGVLVDSCRECRNCREGFEQYCDNGNTETYNSPDRRSGGHTFGGYSSHIVVDQDFVLRIPDGMDPAAAAPMLCAGITTYSPLRRWKVGPGHKVGVVGLGGLGHGGASQQLRFHPGYGIGQARHQPAAATATSRRHVDAGWGSRRNAADRGGKPGWQTS